MHVRRGDASDRGLCRLLFNRKWHVLQDVWRFESSLLPKYATDFIIHKEAVKQVFLDGIGSFLFEHKKTAYPPLPFKLGSYRFTRVKQAKEFVEELQRFHFGEMPYHRNDSHGKVAEHCKENKVHFEYTHHFDREESVFQNSLNMTALKRRKQ